MTALSRRRSPHVDRFVASPNFEPRASGRVADMLLLHYTGMSGSAKALDWLCRPEAKVSSHYLVDEHGMIAQMVEEDQRAWHAGNSSWHGETDTNSRSIGIEIHNAGYDRGYPDFPEAQMRAVEALCVDIVQRHHIVPALVLGHSDVAPGRKIDPGHKFDWQRLARRGVGLWAEPEPIDDGPVIASGDSGERISHMQRHLQDFGYGLVVNGQFDRRTETVVSAFQRHWRPARFDGVWDCSTQVTLQRLAAQLV